MHPSAIGQFKIERELGRGGMGEVYLAHDTRLDRRVAIKAMPAHLAQDADRLARFQREAKVLASLNHPGIAAIYGLEELNGLQYLILEYIEGETLADRLANGPIPVDEAISLAARIAEALEVAHEKGVIHRDLKPSNVMVTSEGVTKVLDFGLARTAEASPSTSGAPASADSPTLTSPARYAHSPTIPGVIMGTAGYMSPEQARGKPVDKRSDIFSFGCVLYEMLTGSQPFLGETVADAIGATLHKESDFRQLPAHTPRRVRDLLVNCLAKDRRQRLHDIGDARLELERALAEPREAAQNGPTTNARWRSIALLLTVSTVTFALLATALLRTRSQSTPSNKAPVVRGTIAFPKGLTVPNAVRSVAVAPEGTQAVLALGPKEGTAPPALFLRDLHRLDFRKLPGTEGASFPFWSPDGKSIAFFADRKLKRIDLADGITRALCDAPAGRGGSWGSKNTIVFAPAAGGGLMIVGDSGGTPTPITTASSLGESHRLPQMLPDGESFLYFIQNHPTSSGVYAFDPRTKQSRQILSGWSEAFFVEPGTLIYSRDENLLAQPFDAQKMELSGTPRPIAADVYYAKTRGFISGGVSARGALIYQLAVPPARSRLAWMDRKGGRTPLPGEPVAISSDLALVSKDGRRAAISLVGSRDEQSVAVIDLERGIRSPLGDPKLTLSWGLLWGPGDQSVITSEDRTAGRNLISLPLDGSPGKPFFRAGPGDELSPSSITSDGKTVLFTQQSLRDKLPDIFTVSLDNPGTATRFLQTPEGEWVPRLSPAGDLVAYCVNDNEDDPTVVLKATSFPSPTAPVQISTSPVPFGAHWWIAPGELAWMDTSRRVWCATLAAKNGGLDVGPARAMFDGVPLDTKIQILDYDLARERFLISIEDQPREDAQLIIVSDWRQGTAEQSSAPR